MAKTLLRIVGSICLLSWIAYKMDWNQVSLAFSKLQSSYWIAAVVLYAVTQIISAYRWQVLAGPLGFEPGLARYTHHYFVGMCFNLFLPTSVGGDVVRALYLDDNMGRKGSALLSVFVDRFSGLAVLLGLACLGVAWIPPNMPRWIATSVVTAATLVAGMVLLLPVASRWIGRLANSERLVRAVWSYRHYPLLCLTALALSLAVQTANVALVWLIGVGLGLEIPVGYYAVFVPMVTLLTLLPVSLNGMGIREGGTILFLAPVGIPAGQAASLAFLWFLVFTTVSSLGALAYLMGSARQREEPVNGSFDHHSDQGRARQPATAA